MCDVWPDARGSQENGEGRHNRVYREPEKAQGANPYRQRDIGCLVGSRVCRNFPPLDRAKSSSFWNKTVSSLTIRQEATLSFTIVSRRRAVVPRHNRDIPKGTLLSLLREAGFTRDELIGFREGK